MHIALMEIRRRRRARLLIFIVVIELIMQFQLLTIDFEECHLFLVIPHVLYNTSIVIIYRVLTLESLELRQRCPIFRLKSWHFVFSDNDCDCLMVILCSRACGISIREVIMYNIDLYNETTVLSIFFLSTPKIRYSTEIYIRWSKSDRSLDTY